MTGIFYRNFGYNDGKMNIDERLDRLTERHEALIQSVELLVHSQHENDQRLRRNEDIQRKNEEIQHKNEVLLTQVIESIDSLARIAHVHKQRISGLENTQS